MEGKIDIKRTGLGMFFKQDWQIPIVQLINSDRFTKKNPLRSRDAWLHTNDVGNKISRPSVIFFLQDLEEAGWLASRKQSGRGGHHDVYWKVCGLNEFIDGKIRSLSSDLGEADLGNYGVVRDE